MWEGYWYQLKDGKAPYTRYYAKSVSYNNVVMWVFYDGEFVRGVRYSSRVAEEIFEEAQTSGRRGN